MTEFISQQANAWEEIRRWAQDAEAHPLIPTKPGGSWDGPGASIDNTTGLRKALPKLLQELGVKTMLDAACGDWNWMRLIDLTGIEYTGWDVDPGRIERCRQRLAIGDHSANNPHATFECVNLLTVPKVGTYDLILCRDFLGHLPNDYINAVLDKFIASASRWLLASTYPNADNEFTYDPRAYAWLGYMEHPVNLVEPPFSLRQVNTIPEELGPGGVLTEEHELGLFPL